MGQVVGVEQLAVESIEKRDVGHGAFPEPRAVVGRVEPLLRAVREEVLHPERLRGQGGPQLGRELRDPVGKDGLLLRGCLVLPEAVLLGPVLGRDPRPRTDRGHAAHVLRQALRVLERDRAVDGVTDHDDVVEAEGPPDLFDVLGVRVDGDSLGSERRIRRGEVPQVDEDQSQVLAQ